MPKCHICGFEMNGLKCSRCKEEYVRKDGVLYRKSAFGRHLESLGKDDFD